MSEDGWRARLPVVIVVASLVAACTGGCTPTAQNPAGNAPDTEGASGLLVSVQPVATGALANVLSYAGTIQARANVNLLPQATGRITRLNVDVGSTVRAGDLLAELDHTQLDAQVVQAAGALGNAQARLALLQAGARPESVDAARATLRAAELQLAQMREGGRAEDVATAQANLQAAQQRLNNLLAGPTQAQAEAARTAAESAYATLQRSNVALGQLLAGGAPADVAQAEAALAQAVAQRELLRHPPADQVQAARSAVEQAEANRQAAQTRLEVILAGGTIADQVAVQDAVDSALAALQAAQQNLVVLLSGGTPAEREAALAAINQARAQLHAARVQYDQLQRQTSISNPANSAQQLADLHAQVAEAQQAQAVRCGSTALNTALSSTPNSGALTSTSSTAQNVNVVPPPAATSPDCFAAQAALDRANAALQNAQQNALQLATQASAADLANVLQVAETAVSNQQAALARLYQLNNPTPDVVQAARSAVEQAQASLQTALAQQEVLRNPSPDTVASARSALESAEAGLRSAQVTLGLLLAGGSPESQRAADAVVAQAQARLDALRNPAAADVTAARAAVDTGRASLAGAAANLADVLAGPKAVDLVAAYAAVDQGQQNLVLQQYPFRPREIEQQQEAVEQARANLALQQEPNRPQEIQQAQTAVVQAQGAYELALAQAAEAYVYAPFDGMVAARLVSEGALATPTTPLVTLISRNVEIGVTIEQELLGQLGEGSPSVVTVSAYPGQTFPAVLAVVSPSADTRTRTFQTKVVPENADGKLKDGMYAQVTIRGETRQDVVVIPNEAIVQRSGKSVAFVVVDDTAQLRELQLGISDGEQTEVLSGLAPGDQLVVVGQESLRDGEPVRVSGAGE